MIVISYNLGSDLVYIVQSAFDTNYGSSTSSTYSYSQSPTFIAFDDVNNILYVMSVYHSINGSHNLAIYDYNELSGQLTLKQQRGQSPSAVLSTQISIQYPQNWMYGYKGGAFIFQGKFVYLGAGSVSIPITGSTTANKKNIGMMVYNDFCRKTMVDANENQTPYQKASSIIDEDPQVVIYNGYSYFQKYNDEQIIELQVNGDDLYLYLREFNTSEMSWSMGEITDALTLDMGSSSVASSNTLTERLVPVEGANGVFFAVIDEYEIIVSVNLGKFSVLAFEGPADNNYGIPTQSCAKMGNWLIYNKQDDVYSVPMLDNKYSIDWGVYSDNGEYVSSGYAHIDPVSMVINPGQAYYHTADGTITTSSSGNVYIGKGVAGNYIYLEKEAGI